MNPAGVIADIDRFAVHDGPGIRMAVYFKGCPLRCRWCHSPELIIPTPTAILVADRCARCGACVAACPTDSHAIEDGRHVYTASRCQGCGQCVAACAYGALSLNGRAVTADDIIRQAMRMDVFFRHSGGGVTLTGGEVMMQPSFAKAILAGCRARGIHTAIETAGACQWEALEHLLPHLDLLLYDLKLLNDEAHRHWTGVSNQLILANAQRLPRDKTVIRIPLIPNITDTEANLRGLFAFMAQCGLLTAELLPYNDSAAAKYAWLGQEYELAHLRRQSNAQLEQYLAWAQDAGLHAELVGTAA